MYNLIIFGTGSGAEKVINSLNNNTQIIAFVDNDKNKQGTTKNGVLIVGPNDIKNLNYDYIVIGSQYNLQIKKQLIDLKVESNKIFDFYSYISKINFVKDTILYFEQSDLKFKVIVTGLSYTQSGFESRECNIQPVKFCFASQDLFYDYNLVKYLIENYKEKMTKIKYALIGLSYYSFQYDMSLSAMKSRVELYYNAINLKHNLKNDEIINKEDSIDVTIADKLLRKNKSNVIEIEWNKNSNISKIKDKYYIGKKQAELDCNKNYPDTVKENIKIMNEYLKILKENNIKPIVVVFPASKYYTKYFSKRIEKEYNMIIEELKEKYEFEYIDYFRSDLFEDEDFLDVSHLSAKGAVKFTKILNDKIGW